MESFWSDPGIFCPGKKQFLPPECCGICNGRFFAGNCSERIKTEVDHLSVRGNLSHLVKWPNCITDSGRIFCWYLSLQPFLWPQRTVLFCGSRGQSHSIIYINHSWVRVQPARVLMAKFCMLHKQDGLFLFKAANMYAVCKKRRCERWAVSHGPNGAGATHPSRTCGSYHFVAAFCCSSSQQQLWCLTFRLQK